MYRFEVEWRHDASGDHGYEVIEAESTLQAEVTFLHASREAGHEGRRCLGTRTIGPA